jgi:hypothetical protein
MDLFHFSEDPSIELFRPRVAHHRPGTEPLVWAIDGWHAPMYYVPRDCPRACFWPGPQTSAEDRGRWYTGIQAKMVMAIQSEWLARLRATPLFRYRMPFETFVLADEIGGHWVSRQEVRPLAVEPMGDLLAALVGSQVELRITPSLVELWQAVVASTLCYSGTRLGKARLPG